MPELRAEVENGPWPSDPEEVCDLVMKGGVASGVVYPGAILALAKRYRFLNVGGTSAGAIAATVTAASELGRREGKDGGFERLREVADDIGTEKRVLGLFQPRPENRAFFDLVTRTMEAKAEGAKATRRVVADSLKQLWLPMILLGLIWLAAVSITGYALFLWLGWWSALAWPVLAAAALVGVLFLATGAVAIALARPARALAKTLSSRETGFGLCPGTTQDGFDQPGLTDWLHTHIQACAGRPPDKPLTFADLVDEEDDSRSISLQLMTTDVSSGRPVRLPLPDDNDFYFDPDEIGQLVPAAVVTCMVEQAKDKTMTVRGKTVYAVPGAGMPVLLATRMSLAVPGLIASVPFYERRPKGAQPEHVEHWFSDGAITSNFPVHFFDSLLPGRPTFGLDLMGAPDPALRAVIDNDSADETLHQVYLPAGPGRPGAASLGQHQRVRRLPGAGPRHRAELARHDADGDAGLPRAGLPHPPRRHRGRPQPEHEGRRRAEPDETGRLRRRVVLALQLPASPLHALPDADADAGGGAEARTRALRVRP